MSKDSLRHPYLLLAFTFVAYIALGLPDALIGVAWPAMRTDFGLPLSALGPLYIATTAGYVLASSTTGELLSRMSMGTLLAGSCALTSVALFGYTLAPSWAILVAFGLLTGFGGGAIDAAINTHAAVQYSTRLVNVLHAFWGVGAALGPALMTATLVRGYDWRVGYGIVIAFELALALASSRDASTGPRQAFVTRIPLLYGLRIRGGRVGVLSVLRGARFRNDLGRRRCVVVLVRSVHESSRLLVPADTHSARRCRLDVHRDRAQRNDRRWNRVSSRHRYRRHRARGIRFGTDLSVSHRDDARAPRSAAYSERCRRSGLDRSDWARDLSRDVRRDSAALSS
jgi:hypothetical protein